MTKLTSFLREAKEELQKVVWPSRRNLLKLSGIVIGVAFVVGFYLSSLDALFGQIVSLLLN